MPQLYLLLLLSSCCPASGVGLRSGRRQAPFAAIAASPSPSVIAAAASVQDLAPWPIQDRPTPFPNGQFRLAASDAKWPRKRSRWRSAARTRTAAYENGLANLHGPSSDDGPPDTHLWRNRSHFKPKGNLSVFWTEICSGAVPPNVSTNATNASSAVEVARPLDDWILQRSKRCAEQNRFGGDFTDQTTALAECGSRCGAVMDVGCAGQTFRLCTQGTPTEDTDTSSAPARVNTSSSSASVVSGVNASSASGANGSSASGSSASGSGTAASADCVHIRPPNYVPPSSEPRGAQDLEFWRSFCNHSTVPFREVFPARLCLTGRVLGQDVPTEAKCAELTALQEGCSDVFDFSFGTPGVCRCAAPGALCDPEPAAPESSVYSLVRDAAL